MDDHVTIIDQVCVTWYSIDGLSIYVFHSHFTISAGTDSCHHLNTFLKFHQITEYKQLFLTHWGRVRHICVGKLSIIASDNGLSPGRRQAIIWTSAGILLIGPLGTNFSEILIGIITFSFKKMHLKVSSAKWRPCCLGLNVLIAN